MLDAILMCLAFALILAAALIDLRLDLTRHKLELDGLSDADLVAMAKRLTIAKGGNAIT